MPNNVTETEEKTGFENPKNLSESPPDDILAKVNPEEIREPEQSISVKPAQFQQLTESEIKPSENNISLLLDVKLPVSIELGKTILPIEEILSLGPGSIIELEKLAGEPVDVLINNKKIAQAEVVVVEENFGVRITSLVSPEERIKNI
jgi:flagellar motor switch protein FliN/FliY